MRQPASVMIMIIIIKVDSASCESTLTSKSKCATDRREANSKDIC